MRPIRRRRGSRGFTIIELAVVGGTISILMAIALPRITSTFKRVRFAEARNTVSAIENAMRESWGRVDKYPQSGAWNPLNVADNLPREMDATLDGWKDLAFKPEGSYRYRYMWTTSADGKEVTIHVRGNTDGDGNTGEIIRYLKDGYRSGNDFEDED